MTKIQKWIYRMCRYGKRRTKEGALAKLFKEREAYIAVNWTAPPQVEQRRAHSDRMGALLGELEDLHFAALSAARDHFPELFAQSPAAPTPTGRKCAVCGGVFDGYGHNAQPLADGDCCDACNAQVLRARMLGIASGAQTPVTWLKTAGMPALFVGWVTRLNANEIRPRQTGRNVGLNEIKGKGVAGIYVLNVPCCRKSNSKVGISTEDIEKRVRSHVTCWPWEFYIVAMMAYDYSGGSNWKRYFNIPRAEREILQ
eukprot:gene6729-549_t